MVSKFYKRNIAEGRPILYFSFAFALVIRIIYFLLADHDRVDEISNGHLWSPIQFLYIEELLLGFFCLLFIVALAVYINKRFVLIRVRTALVGGTLLLTFSSHPVFFAISPEYLSSLAILASIGLLFGAYESSRKQVCALYIGGILAFGSLFQTSLLFYFPLCWIGLMVMNSFSFKSFLASLVGLILIYIPVFVYFLFAGKLDLFIAPFTEITEVDWLQLPVLKMNPNEIAMYILAVVSLLIVLVCSYNSRYNDKIKIRAYIFFLVLITVAVSIAASFINFAVSMNLHIAMCTASLLVAHFFALTSTRWISWYYYTFLVLTIILSFTNLFYVL